MTETSFPVVEKPLTEDQWATIAHSFGQGVIDQGGLPYGLGTIDDVADTITITVDTITGKNEGIVRGFVHSIDHAKALTLPAVSSTTTYEIGLVYDPLNHGTDAGPVRLDVWTSPGDTTGGKVRVVLYRVTRSPSSALSTSTIVENRQRISPQIVVTATADLPPTSAVLVDTVARVRATGERWAAAIDGSGVVSWVKIDSNAELDNATHLATPDTIAKRASNGGLRIVTGTNSQDATNVSWVNTRLDDALGTGWVQATPTNVGHSIMRRYDSGVARVTAPSSSSPDSRDIVNVGYGDGRYRRQGVSIDAEQLLKTGNPVWWEIVTGSKSAYSDTDSTSTWATVGVTSGGKFFRYTSARKYKTNIEPWRPDPRVLLRITPSRYQRINPETGAPYDRWEVGVIADDAVKFLPELGEYGPDEHGNPSEVEGWQYAQWTAAQQVVARWLARRVDGHDQQLAEVGELRAEVARLRDLVNGVEPEGETVTGPAPEPDTAPEDEPLPPEPDTTEGEV